MTKKDTIIATIGYLETGLDCIRKYDTKGINLEFMLISVEVAMRKAKKNLEWLALLEKGGDGMKSYTIEEIKAAFWDEFHLGGERWFNYLGTDEVNEDSTQSAWESFLEELEKKGGENEISR